MAKVVCEKCGTTYKYEIVKDMKTCPVCGVSLFAEDDNVGKSETQGEEEHPDWITWYYYKDPKYGDYSLWDKLPLKPEELELIKEFKAPPRDSVGSSDRAKEILRTYIPDAFKEPKKTESTICCPWCGSSEFTLLNRGYSLLTGFLGSGKVKRVCNKCKKEF